MNTKYSVVTADVAEIQGTSLCGYIPSTYDDLVKVFGEPTCTDTSGDGKVDVEWILRIIDHEFDDEEHIATIYNWKDYDGGVEARSGKKYNWHIGGHRKLVAGMLIDVFLTRLGRMPS